MARWKAWSADHRRRHGIKLPKKKPIYLRRWRDLTHSEKFVTGSRAIEEVGGCVFTLNISPKTESAAKCHTDPVAYLAKRINRELVALGLRDAPYTFRLDVSRSGRLHLHGAALVPLEGRGTLKDALRASAGKFSVGAKFTGKGSGHIVEVKAFSDAGAENWVSYSRKANSKVSDYLTGRSREYLSNSAVKLARERHEQDVHLPLRCKDKK